MVKMGYEGLERHDKDSESTSFPALFSAKEGEGAWRRASPGEEVDYDWVVTLIAIFRAPLSAMFSPNVSRPFTWWRI